MHEGQVTFRWRDSADGNQQKLRTLDAIEFIRRFLLHILPPGFVKIRHFGFLAHPHRRSALLLAQKLLRAPVSPGPWPDAPPEAREHRCPRCGLGTLLFPRMDSRRSRYRFAGVPPGLRGFIVTLRMNCSRLSKHPRPSNTRSAEQCWECVRNSILLRWEPLFGFLPRLENHCRNLLGQPILLCRLPFRPPENRSIPL